MSKLDQIEADATPTVAHADLCVDGRLLAEYLDAREQLAGQKTIKTAMLEDAELEAVSARFAELHRQVAEKTRRYTFRCLPRPEREALQDKHPPTERQSKKGYEWNSDTYEPVLAGTCLIEIDGEAVDEPEERRIKHFEMLYASLPQGPNGWGVVAKALNEANFEGSQVPKSVRDIGDQFVSALNSITPQNGESPSASSGDVSPPTANRTGSRTTTTPRSRGSKSKT